jgi:hypothetical protein
MRHGNMSCDEHIQDGIALDTDENTVYIREEDRAWITERDWVYIASQVWVRLLSFLKFWHLLGVVHINIKCLSRGYLAPVYISRFP